MSLLCFSSLEIVLLSDSEGGGARVSSFLEYSGTRSGYLSSKECAQLILVFDVEQKRGEGYFFLFSPVVCLNWCTHFLQKHKEPPDPSPSYYSPTKNKLSRRAVAVVVVVQNPTPLSGYVEKYAYKGGCVFLLRGGK